MAEELAVVQTELQSLIKKRNDLNASIASLERQKRKILFATHDIIYRIQCSPSKKNHVPHRVGVFSSYEEATKHLPNKGSSYDAEDCCTWYYLVVAEEASEQQMTHLDKSLPHFPYTGW